MPWLSRQNSSSSVNSDDSLDDGPRRIVDSTVGFIPAQIDGLCGTRCSRQKRTPLQTLVADLGILMHNISCVSLMARSLYKEQFWKQHRDLQRLKEASLQLVLAFSQVWLLLLVMPGFLLSPGFIFLLFVGAIGLVIACLSWPLNRARIVMIRQPPMPKSDDMSDEQWYFVNGSMVSTRSLASQCTRIAATFGRPVTGVHNRTYGILFDLIVSLYLRSTGQPSSCTRTLTSQLRDACLNNTVRKVIVLAHGTGAVHLSMALDMLHSDLPVDVLFKLEIYTFGSAASHISNPLIHLETLKNAFNPSDALPANPSRPDGTVKSPAKTALALLGNRTEDQERVIPHIEHYAFSNDFYARCGILHSIRNVLDGRFCGRTLILQADAQSPHAGEGFLFEEHYLEALFPTTGKDGILDTIIAIDNETAEKREFTAMGVALPMKTLVVVSRRAVWETSSCTSIGSPETSSSTKGGLKRSRSGMREEKRASWGTAGALGIDGVGKARMGVRNCEGRSVRQVSRLWRYAKGQRVVGEGVSLFNSVGTA